MFLQKIKAGLSFFLCLAIILSLLACAPIDKGTEEDAFDGQTDEQTLSPTENSSGTADSPDDYPARVTFLDVGNGECILIKFPDGKTMLVDCGENSSAITEKVDKYISEEWNNKIDYFVYTHPDYEHTGNAERILNNNAVGKVFLPKIISPNDALFPDYIAVCNIISEKQITKAFSYNGAYIKGEGYSVAFLTPERNGGSYARFNGEPSPTAEDIDNLSPIIYLDIFGVRFLLTGDARKTEEEGLLANDKSGVYAIFESTADITVDLDGVDYLKVAGGGFNEGSSQDFLNRLAPKTAVFFLAGNNYQGNPQTTVLKRLQNANENYRIIRTDVSGNFDVYIDQNKKILEKKGN